MARKILDGLSTLIFLFSLLVWMAAISPPCAFEYKHVLCSCDLYQCDHRPFKRHNTAPFQEWDHGRLFGEFMDELEEEVSYLRREWDNMQAAIEDGRSFSPRTEYFCPNRIEIAYAKIGIIDTPDPFKKLTVISKYPDMPWEEDQ